MEKDLKMEEAKEEKNRKDEGSCIGEAAKRRFGGKRKWLIPLIILAIIACIYLAGAAFFNSHFLPNTVINGVACSLKTTEQGKEAFDEKANTYTLELLERDDTSEEIVGADIGLTVNLGDTLSDVLESQNGFLWFLAFFDEADESVDAAISYDSEKLNAVLNTLNCMDESQMYDSVNATLSDYVAGSGYEMADAVHGTRINEDVLLSVLDTAILNFQESIDLAAENCYIEPEYTEDSDEALAMLDMANRYVNTTVTFTFGEQSEVIGGDLISTWLVVGEDCSVSLNQEAEAEYIKSLASKYDTKWQSRTLITHSGSTVTVPAGGNYGWRVNQEDTLTALNGYLESGEDYTGELVWYQTAAQFDDPDYGSTYIEVSISAQHFWFYQNGTVVLESDFVSGDSTKGRDTPKGCYRIAYKARNYTLVGENYETPVSYWMPFVDGCGFHDADWRSSFGGTIYQGNGSHGCLNLPVSAAQQLYDLVEAGMAVLIY